VAALAEVERLAGDAQAERAALEEVVRLAELKGMVDAERARLRIEALGVAPSA